MKSSFRDIFWALVVRAILTCHTFIAIWRTTAVTLNNKFWYILVLNVLVLAETIYRIKVRRGKEGKWFCPCFLFYLICTVPAIYILELDRLERYNVIYSSQNTTVVETLSSIQGVTLPITLRPNIWVSVIEQSMLFLMILVRWLLPRGGLTRGQLSQLLFVYIGMGSDNMELFVLFEEPPVRKDKMLTYGILGIWTISLLQFSVVLTATKKPNSRSRVSPSGFHDQRDEKESLLVGCLKTELWSLLLTFVCQDGPYLSIRLYTMIHYQLVTYSIIFFTCKNLFLIGLLLYRLYAMHFGTDEDDAPEADVVEPKARTSNALSRQHLRQSTSSMFSKGTDGSASQGSPFKQKDKNGGIKQSPKVSKGLRKISVVALDL